jgi:hypothetical protein
MSVPKGNLLQLPTRAAIQYVQKMQTSNEAFARLIAQFTAEGFTFHMERAKVFMFSTPAFNAKGAADQPDEPVGAEPYLLGILPSFIKVKASDPSHVAIGISVLSNGSVVAARVTVSHNPFRITDFTVHFPQGTKVVSRTVSASRLQDASLATVSSELTKNVRPPATPRGANAVVPAGDRSMLEAIVTDAMHEILQDDYARPLYTPEGFQALLDQTSLAQKFGLALAVGGPLPLSAGIGRRGFACSCTCCNGCTTTSITISMK